MEVVDLGRLPYEEGLDCLHRYRAQLSPGHSASFLLLLEHDPVITLGLRPAGTGMLATPEDLALRGIAFRQTDRGGLATAHEPGQLVVYPVLRPPLGKAQTRVLVECLEDAVIEILEGFGIAGTREPEHGPGVWVGGAKLAACGLRLQDGVTKHGLAFNVTNSLATFAWIRPCGLQAPVTTLSRLLDSPAPSLWEEVKGRLSRALVTRLLPYAS